jgi:hypothetical protein
MNIDEYTRHMETGRTLAVVKEQIKERQKALEHTDNQEGQKELNKLIAEYLVLDDEFKRFFCCDDHPEIYFPNWFTKDFFEKVLNQKLTDKQYSEWIELLADKTFIADEIESLIKMSLRSIDPASYRRFSDLPKYKSDGLNPSIMRE